MNTAETGFVDVGGQRIRYSVRGEGPALVFVHGWTLNLGYWEAQVAHFASRYRTYCYDWRGMGQSSGATPAYTMADLAEELRGVMAALGIESPVICGHSEGGAIAAQYAAEHPDAVRALVLADTDLNDAAEVIAGTFRLALTEFFTFLQRKAGKDPLAGMMPNLQRLFFSENFTAAHPGAIAAWQQQFLSNSVDGVMHGLRAWNFRHGLAAQLKQFRAPTLLVWGRADAMIRFDEMQRLQGYLAGMSQLTTLPGSGHMTPVEVPELFNRVLESFLDLHVFAPSERPLTRVAAATIGGG